jgi:hypothetical protein
MFGRKPTIPLDQLIQTVDTETWNDNFRENQTKFLKRAYEIASSRIQAIQNSDKVRWDKKIFTKPLKILLKKSHFTSRHKLENRFESDPFILENLNENKDVCGIRPLLGGRLRQVNRGMIILDPREEAPNQIPDIDIHFGFEIEDITSDNDRDSSNSDSENDSDSDIVWIFEQNPQQIPGEQVPLEQQPLGGPSGPSSATGRSSDIEQSPPLRRSSRLSRGQHSNIHHLPRSSQTQLVSYDSPACSDSSDVE